MYHLIKNSFYSSDLNQVEMIWAKTSFASQNPKTRKELIEFSRKLWDLIDHKVIRSAIIKLIYRIYPQAIEDKVLG